MREQYLETADAMRIVNPYRYSAGVWTPPGTPDEWHYGNTTEGSGAWTDQSGNGNHAALVGSASIGANGLTGASTSDYATAGGSFGVNNTWTVSAWAFVPADATGDIALVGGNVDSGTQTWLDRVAGPLWRLAHYDGAIDAGSTSSDLRGSWIHCAFSCASGTLTIYRNASSDGSGDSSITADEFTELGYVGGSKGLDGGFLDDVFIYDNEALSGTDIADIYNNSPGTHV